MLIVYESRTGHVKQFVGKLGLRAIPIAEAEDVAEPYVLITYTTGFGQIPDKVLPFLQRHHRYLRGVAASGNRNWGENFAKSADLVAMLYNVPVLGKFELSGTRQDVEQLGRRVNGIAACGAEQPVDAEGRGWLFPAG